MTQINKKVQNTLATIPVFLLIGCASVSPTYTADGKQGFALTCSGTARNWGMCYEKAGEMCGTKGYKVLEKSDEHGAMASVDNTSAFATTTNTRSMIIRCGK